MALADYVNSKLVIHTSRLRLRPMNAGDVPALREWMPEKPTKSFYLGIEEKQSGKGYGTEALSEMIRFCFENTQLQRLWTEFDARNIPSQRMLEKCGYIKEGMIRQGKMVNTWCDYFIYGILSSDLAGR